MSCDSAVKSAFGIGLMMAIEETCGVAASTSTNRYYWQGGRWIPVVTSTVPAIEDRQAQVFSPGYAGRRARNTRAPVAGRQWSDGQTTVDVTSDFFPILLYAAMGSVSANAIPSTDFNLGSEDLVAETSHVVVLDSQPSDGGAILRFVITGTSAAGHISVQGINANGDGASEIIGFTSAGSMYTRTSFSAIGASSITIWSNNGGSVVVDGFKYWDYIISENNVNNPTMTLERIGDPRAGATSRAFQHTNMGITELNFAVPADSPDGVISTTFSVEGFPATVVTAGSIGAASSQYVWPSWVLALTRDGSNWHKVTNADFSYIAGVQNYLAAAGTQSPQGKFFGSRELTGSMDVLVNDEGEYNRWRGLSSQVIVWDMNSPRKLTTNDNLQMTASMNQLFIEDGNLTENNDMLSFGIQYRNVEDSANGLMKWHIKSNLPPSAFAL